jgi:uncharacterized protein with ATP-grasp and redox domains
MRMSPECVPCLVRRVLFEAEECNSSKAYEAVRTASEMLGELFGEDVCSAQVASKVHRAIYDILGTDDPYADLKVKSNEDLKVKSNEVALELYPAAERFVRSSKDRLKASFLCAVVGNVLDFGIGTGFDHPATLRKEFRNLLDEGLGHDDTPKVRKLLAKADSVVYMADNCGEVVLDRLALAEIHKSDVDLTFVVKGEPILTDATLADIRGLGIEKLVDRVVESPGFAVGVDLDALDGPFGKMLRDADLVIAKGMGNFEAVSETDIAPIAYMLRTKCRPVAEAMGLPKDINAVKLFPRGRASR